MSTLEAKGVDIKSGKPPGMMEMAKLAMASEVREATAEGACTSAGRRE